MNKEYSFPKEKIKILLIEGVHPVAVERLKSAGYNVEADGKSLTHEQLLERIPEVHVLGVRSKTKIAKEHLQAAKRLLCIGCFGVGTNQVALEDATNAGVPVFNAPFGNTRSVAELTIGSIINLARKIGDKNNLMHKGHWNKSAKGAVEIRDKTLGVVGYGHIGQQVALLAEALGLRVIFYDKIKRLPLGNARQADSVDEVLSQSDFVSLHVPALPGNKTLIGKAELARMKKGAFLMNMSRGSLIDFAALKEAIQAKHIGGAAIDVYPAEPKSNDEPFAAELAGVENVLLTPHIGGSTEEAQYNIGAEVASVFEKYIDTGATMGAVNFPQLDQPQFPESHRILNIHRNEPGVLKNINQIISDLGANIDSQSLSTYKGIGYLIMDINKTVSDEVKDKISALPTNIKTRILY